MKIRTNARENEFREFGDEKSFCSCIFVMFNFLDDVLFTSSVLENLNQNSRYTTGFIANRDFRAIIFHFDINILFSTKSNKFCCQLNLVNFI